MDIGFGHVRRHGLWMSDNLVRHMCDAVRMDPDVHGCTVVLIHGAGDDEGEGTEDHIPHQARGAGAVLRDVGGQC